jgi:hypothetical protein
MEDVYTEMGDAVVIGHRCFKDGKEQAYVTGKHFTGHKPIAELTAKEDL